MWIKRLFTLLVLGSSSACAMETGETESLDTDAQEIRLGPSSQTLKCEGYTSGGGQRVRGEIKFERYSKKGEDGVVRYGSTLWVEASNWKKNIGWNTKRTHQLRIEGKVRVFEPCPDNPYPSCVNTIEVPVFFDTEGDLRTEIRGYAWISPLRKDGNLIQVEPDIMIYGRHGTSCRPE